MPHAPTTLYRTPVGVIAFRDGEYRQLATGSFDEIFVQEKPADWLQSAFSEGSKCTEPELLLAPIDSQEVWAAGVTYLRSRDARKEESRDTGGGQFYDRVYDAERPEIFFKATKHRVVAPSKPMRLRSDALWNVPEPELTLAINRFGSIFGYTIGNDLSSRDIEGENPLYLPQAKVWSDCCALGPGLVVRDQLPNRTRISLSIKRSGAEAFRGETSLDQMKRTLDELAAWLWRDNCFPAGTYLMTGTGTVPPNDFTLNAGDVIEISIEGLGTLTNSIASKKEESASGH
jgi:2-dehydro-3-deoxy-D-arabinonate dehydratase